MAMRFLCTSSEESGKPLRSFYRKAAIALILLALLGSAISVGLRCFFREPVSDDLLYAFVLDDHILGDNDLRQRVTGWNDAFTSQSTQYFHSNGRLIVHLFVQMFAGPWGADAYAVATGCMMFAVMLLFGLYCFPKRMRYNPLMWIGIAITYLYLFQGNCKVWYSIAGGMNYLYPMLPVLIFLMLFRHFITGKKKASGAVLTLLGICGCITGWSQECFSLPLSGGIFIYLCLAAHKHQRIPTPIRVLAISLWIGTCILVAAPGNFIRLEQSRNMFIVMKTGVKYLIETKLFWLMLAGMIALRIRGKSVFKAYITDNSLLMFTLSTALCFGMIANTLPQSFNGISFYSALLLFGSAAYHPRPSDKTFPTIVIVSAALLAIFFWHQARIVEGCKVVRESNRELVQEYLCSADGVVAMREVSLPADVAPYVENWYNSDIRWWLVFTLEQYYTHGKKPLTLLDNKAINRSTP